MLRNVLEVMASTDDLKIPRPKDEVIMDKAAKDSQERRAKEGKSPTAVDKDIMKKAGKDSQERRKKTSGGSGGNGSK